MKKKITVTVCDACGDESKVTDEYRLALPGGRLKAYDVCDDDAKPLLRLAGEKKIKATRAPRQKAPTKLTVLE